MESDASVWAASQRALLIIENEPLLLSHAEKCTVTLTKKCAEFLKIRNTLWNTKYRANIKYLNSSVFPHFLLTGVGICTQAKQMFVNW